MRKFVVFVSLLCVLCSLAVGASAATGAKSVSAHATVTADGRCQITLVAAIHLDAPVEDLKFPLPKSAENITVNGSRASVKKENDLKQVDISRLVGKTAGDFTLTFNYALPNLVHTNDAGLLELTLPLLSGFAYPVQAMEFSVTLPGEITAKPAFSSGYHQASIETDIAYTVAGPTVSGASQVELKDHETLVMTLTVTDELFPRTVITPPDLETVNVIAIVCFVAALLYWALFLRNLPWWPGKQPTPPDGYGPGEMGSVLHLQGGEEKFRPGVRARLTRAMASAQGRRDYVRVRLSRTEEGWAAEPILLPSGLMSGLVHADAIVICPENSEGLYAGEEVWAELLA